MHEESKGFNRVRSIRLSTLLLLIVVMALLFGLFALKRREAYLLDSLSYYRNERTEGIYDALSRPLDPMYPDTARLDEVLKLIRKRTTGRPKLPTGIPIYVDPIGLQEAGTSLGSPVKKPLSLERPTLGEHLRRILEPLGLAYEVKDGYLMITSKESLDEPLSGEAEPYLQFRDVLQ
jgi:hypothetical protein